jgi:ketosteroid isomerase-like protein
VLTGFLVLAALTSSPVPSRQAVPADSVRTVAIRLADGRVLRCSMEEEPRGSGWTPIVPRVPGATTSRDGLELSALDHACGRSGGEVTVTISLWYGSPHQRRIPVATVVARDGITVRVDELRAYGVQPVEISIETHAAPALRLPAVASASSALQVSAEVEGPPAPGYVFHLLNTNTQPVMEVKYRTYRGAAAAGMGGAHHVDGTALIQPGETYTVRQPAAIDSRTGAWMPTDRFVIDLVTWADGSQDRAASSGVERRVPLTIDTPPAGSRPPSPPHTSATTQTRAVSGSTVATLVTQDWSAVDLLVLWRGTPGWFMVPDYQPSKGGSGPLFEGTLFFNGRSFDWDIDFVTRIAHLAGTRLDLKNDNVVLVDRIDAPGGPRIVKTLKVDENPAVDFPDLGPLVWRIPELAAYLQCDQRFADPKLQTLHAFVCTPVNGPSPELATRAVDLMLSRFAQLSRAMDAAGVAKAYARDGELVNPGQDVIKGRAAIQSFLERFAAYAILSYELAPTSTTGDRNGVTQKGTFHQRVRTPDGQIVEASGTFTAEWVLEDYVWHIKRMTTERR